MGLSDFEQLLLFLHRWFPEAFYPKCREVQVPLAQSSGQDITTFFFKQKKTDDAKDSPKTTTAFDPDQVVWPDGLNSLGCAIDEMNGTVRTLPLGTKEERVRWYEEAKQQAREDKRREESGFEDDAASDQEEEAVEEEGDLKSSGGRPSQESVDEELEALLYPEDVLKYFFDRYSRIFYHNGAGEIHVVWDCIGWTPAIKGILRTPAASKRVVWPKKRETLFTGNHRFQNSIHDFFDDKEARKLLYEFLTTAILERFPKEGYFPQGSRVVVWGGWYKGTEMCKPLYVENDALKGISAPTGLDDPTAPLAEADVLIGYIVRQYIGYGHIMVLSKDSDFIPVLLSVMNQHYKTSPNPTKYRVFFSHKILVKSKISQEEHAKLQRDLAVNNTATEEEDIDAILKAFGDDPAEAAPADAFTVKHFPTKTSSPSTPKGSPIPPPPTAGARKRKTADDGEVPMVEIKAKIREVIDINALYEKVWTMMHATHKTCTLCDPMDAFFALVFLSGCDYMKKLPSVTFKTLCYIYFTPETHKQVGCLCPYDGGVFRLRLSSFKTLAALAFKHFRNLKNEELKAPNSITYEDVRNAMAKRKANNENKAALAAKKAAEKMPQQIRKPRKAPEYVPPEHPERYAANLVWIVNYYTRSYQPGWTPSNGLEVDPKTGLSLYGYRKIKSTNPTNKKKDKYDFAEKVLTRDVF